MAVAQGLQYLDDPVAEARAFLEQRGLVFGVHFVESTAIAVAAELVWLRGFGAKTAYLPAPGPFRTHSNSK